MQSIGRDRRALETALALAAYGLLALLATESARAATDAPNSEKVQGSKNSVSAIVETEEIILSLTPLLTDLDRSVMNLRLPDHNSERLFYSDVRYNRLSDTTPPRWAMSSGRRSRTEVALERSMSCLRSERR